MESEPLSSNAPWSGVLITETILRNREDAKAWRGGELERSQHRAALLGAPKVAQSGLAHWLTHVLT